MDPLRVTPRGQNENPYTPEDAIARPHWGLKAIFWISSLYDNRRSPAVSLFSLGFLLPPVSSKIGVRSPETWILLDVVVVIDSRLDEEGIPF
jgi:hypothetical protein